MGFNLRSGNSSGLKFKQMGSSPAKNIIGAAAKVAGDAVKKDKNDEEDLPTSERSVFYNNKSYTDKVYNKAIDDMIKDKDR